MQLIEQLNNFASKGDLKSAPEESIFMHLTVKIFGPGISVNTNEPLPIKILAGHKIPNPTTKIEVMTFIGSLNFYSKFIGIVHANIKLLYDLLNGIFEFHLNSEIEKLCQQNKTSITKQFTLRLPNTNHPLFVTVFSFLSDIGCVQFQMSNKENWMLPHTVFVIQQLKNKTSVLLTVNYSDLYIY